MALLLNKNAANSSLPTFRSFVGPAMQASGTIGGENHLTEPLSITNPAYSFLLVE